MKVNSVGKKKADICGYRYICLVPTYFVPTYPLTHPRIQQPIYYLPNRYLPTYLATYLPTYKPIPTYLSTYLPTFTLGR